MTITYNEAKDLVRNLINEDRVKENLNTTIVLLGEKVQVSENGDKGIRFDFPDMKISFAFMSGRLYKREYTTSPNIPQKSENRVPPGAEYMRQRDYIGGFEDIDTRVYTNKLICECGQVRWVKNADLFQVKKCKPCTYQDRKERRRKKSRSASK